MQDLKFCDAREVTVPRVTLLPIKWLSLFFVTRQLAWFDTENYPRLRVRPREAFGTSEIPLLTPVNKTMKQQFRVIVLILFRRGRTDYDESPPL